MITEDGRGFLIDWDLAKNVDPAGARTPGRTVCDFYALRVIGSDADSVNGRVHGNSYQLGY
jgi:hypothetical protein